MNHLHIDWPICETNLLNFEKYKRKQVLLFTKAEGKFVEKSVVYQKVE